LYSSSFNHIRACPPVCGPFFAAPARAAVSCCWKGSPFPPTSPPNRLFPGAWIRLSINMTAYPPIVPGFCFLGLGFFATHFQTMDTFFHVIGDTFFISNFFSFRSGVAPKSVLCPFAFFDPVPPHNLQTTPWFPKRCCTPPKLSQLALTRPAPTSPRFLLPSQCCAFCRLREVGDPFSNFFDWLPGRNLFPWTFFRSPPRWFLFFSIPPASNFSTLEGCFVP